MAYKLAKVHKDLFLEKQQKNELVWHGDDGQITKSDCINDGPDLSEFSESVESNASKLSRAEKSQLKDLEGLYWKAFNTLEKIYDT